MGQFNRVGSIVLASALITTTLSAPIHAAIRQPFHSLQTEKGTYIALSWGDIWNLLSNKRKLGGRRGGGICAIAPAKLVDSDSPPSSQGEILEVWSDRPLFLWQGEGVEKIELLLPGSQKPWSREIKPGETKISYDGELLQPGQTYKWLLSAPFSIQQPSFQVMEPQKRDRISAELMQREERLKGASAETIALEKANFFAEKGLWADALQELYSVPNPSAELTGMIRQIEAHDFCKKDESNTSSSG